MLACLARERERERELLVMLERERLLVCLSRLRERERIACLLAWKRERITTDREVLFLPPASQHLTDTSLVNSLFVFLFLCCKYLEKEDFLENLHVLSCFVQLKSILFNLLCVLDHFRMNSIITDKRFCIIFSAK